MLQIVSNYAGLFSMILTIAGAVILAINAGKSSADTKASEAQAKTIDAMQARLDVQSSSIEEMKKENVRLQLIIETITSALKGMGLIVTIEGEMVRVRDDKNNSTTTRIHNDKVI